MTKKIYISITLYSIWIMSFCASFTVLATPPVHSVQVDLYGHSVALPKILPYVKQSDVQAYSQPYLACVVSHYSDQIGYTSFTEQVNAIKAQWNMDDMVMLMLLKKYTSIWSDTYDCSADENILLFSMLKLFRIDVKLGYTDSHLTVYARTNFWIDNVVFVKLNDHYYFDLSFDQKKLAMSGEVLYHDEHVSKPLPLVMNMIAPPAFGAKTKKLVIPFEYDGFTYFFTAKTNYSLVEYYRDLPTLDINTLYLNYGFSTSLQNSLIKELKKATEGMKPEIAVEFLLKFTQQAFTYRKDEEVYGMEKFSFPEETIMNTFSDCEDKAILFASLTKEILGLHSVALYYKNASHINIALQTWNAKAKGNFTFNDKNYIICEPTISGYGLGDVYQQISVANVIDW